MQTKESSTVKRTLDLTKPPILTAEQQARLDAVAAMPDEQIDYKDAQYLPSAVWAKASDQATSRQTEVLQTCATHSK